MCEWPAREKVQGVTCLIRRKSPSHHVKCPPIGGTARAQKQVVV